MKERENPEFAYSKNAAIERSVELLQMQSEVHDATQPGGLLCKDLWVISSLAIHDLLLAAVIYTLASFRIVLKLLQPERRKYQIPVKQR